MTFRVADPNERDNDVLFGVSEGCPCNQDSFIMKILGRTTTPNAMGEYQLNLKYVDTTGYVIGTGFYFLPTTFGYDSLIQTVWPLSNRHCIIDGWLYWKEFTGRMYGNDSLVLHFFYTRPNPVPGTDDQIISPQTCKMVVRN